MPDDEMPSQGSGEPPETAPRDALAALDSVLAQLEKAAADAGEPPETMLEFRRRLSEIRSSIADGNADGLSIMEAMGEGGGVLGFASPIDADSDAKPEDDPTASDSGTT